MRNRLSVARWIVPGAAALAATLWGAVAVGLRAADAYPVPVAPWAGAEYGADAAFASEPVVMRAGDRPTALAAPLVRVRGVVRRAGSQAAPPPRERQQAPADPATPLPDAHAPPLPDSPPTPPTAPVPPPPPDVPRAVPRPDPEVRL